MAFRVAFPSSHLALPGQATGSPAPSYSLLSSQSSSPALAFNCGRGGKDLYANSNALACRICLPEDTNSRSRGINFIVKAVEQAAATSVGGVTDVSQDTFWPIVEAAGNKLVVLDMYTQWCGPCKIILPKLVALSEKYTDVVFLKLDCNQHNKALAKELGVKVVPTFKLLKNREIVAEVKGAKYDDLLQNIEKLRAS